MGKILISTYCHWNSFGSMLQSLGLQSALGDMDVETIVFSDEETIPAITKVPIRPNMSTVNYFFIEADEHGISLSEEPEVRRC